MPARPGLNRAVVVQAAELYGIDESFHSLVRMYTRGLRREAALEAGS